MALLCCCCCCCCLNNKAEEEEAEAVENIFKTFANSSRA
jgi:hypothetical protein